METFSILELIIDFLSRQMVDLKHIKHQVATREGRDMDEWLENVEGRERELDEIRNEFEVLRRNPSYNDVINSNTLQTLARKVIENLKAVNHLTVVGNASIEPSPAHSNKMIHKTFLHEDLIKFTSKFTENVGSGGFSNVYKGHLDDDKQVAVKVLKNSVVIGDFMAEMQTMVMASHPNLVTLYGFCFDYNMKALVYEFMENGSFDKIMFDNHLSLEWGKLYEIALGIAKGLAYLHCNCAKQIIHRDVKPSNVLIDINLSPKITDFGLAKLISKDADHYTISQNKGTKGYVAPEFGFPTSLITNKCDVYSFGVMLFEVLGKRGNGEFGANWFPVQIWKKFENGQLDELIKSFDIPETHKGKAKILSMVAFWCCQYTVEIRPSMNTVVEVLENEIIVNAPPYPFAFQTFLDFPMLPSQEVILEIRSEASSVVRESLALSNPTLVDAAPEEAEKDADDEQAMSNFSEQVLSEEGMTTSETQKLLSELTIGRPHQFSLSDIERFTSNFSKYIGRGDFGDVYKGQLLTGVEVAIEVLHDIGDILDETTFMGVVMTMGKLYHPNIVKLHGYCFDGHMKALVYEYIRNGSLDMILYKNHRPDMDWDQLYEVAIEIAKELSALHAVGIIHRDIEASSILLDSSLSPKITSVELEGLIIMKRDDDAARIIRSVGYSSPEMWMPASVVTSKCDVYSFGMLLFEILGKRSISNHRGQEWFPAQVWKMFNKGLLSKVMDDCGINKKDRRKAYNLSKVALWCAQFDPEGRPSMNSVVKMLEMDIPVMDPPNPFPHAQLSSTSSSPEVSPRFNSGASPSVELRYE